MRKITAFAIFAALITNGCEEAIPPETEVKLQQTATETAQTGLTGDDGGETQTMAGQTVLGAKIPNAYTPEVMRQAWEELRSTNKSLSTEKPDFTATHLYIRFAPRDSTDVMTLEGDTTIMFTNIPMDYEVEAIGDYYHDPSLPDSVPTYMYCAVKVGQELPNVPHETLSELFLMEDTNVYDDTADESENKSVNAIWEELERKAREIVGIEDQAEEDGTNKSKWRPGGRILYEDTELGTIPLEGVPVRIQFGFVTHQCCTDADGYFTFSKRRSRVSYSIKWRRDEFHLREKGHPLQVAESTLRRKTKSRVEHTIVKGYDSWLYASVFRGAHSYFYKYGQYGISKPKERNLAIKFSSETSGTAASECRRLALPLIADMVVYYKKLSKSQDFFHSTLHEVAHRTHRLWDKKAYRECEKRVIESWARGVAWHATILSYPNYTRSYNSTYTGIVQDLIDSDSSFVETKTHGNIEDKVKGVSISDIEKSLKGSRTWIEWRDNLTALHHDKKEDITDLFLGWADYIF